ncbi:MAG: hypothetical protein AB7V18_10925, partial [Pyrinomonadaceae bacterium]
IALAHARACAFFRPTTRLDRTRPACKRRLPASGSQNGQFTVARVCYTRNGIPSAVRTVGETRFFENECKMARQRVVRKTQRDQLENQGRSGKPRTVGEGWNPKLFFE